MSLQDPDVDSCKHISRNRIARSDGTSTFLHFYIEELPIIFHGSIATNSTQGSPFPSILTKTYCLFFLLVIATLTGVRLGNGEYHIL